MNKKKIFLTIVLAPIIIFGIFVPLRKIEAVNKDFPCCKSSNVGCTMVSVLDDGTFDGTVSLALKACKDLQNCETQWITTGGLVACVNYAVPTPAPADPNVVNLENPIGIGQKGTTEATQIIATVITTALGIIGALTLLMLVYGGFQWLTSAGNPEKVKMGTQTMVWAIIGVLLVFASYILLSTFLNYLTGGTT